VQSGIRRLPGRFEDRVPLPFASNPGSSSIDGNRGMGTCRRESQRPPHIPRAHHPPHLEAPDEPLRSPSSSPCLAALAGCTAAAGEPRNAMPERVEVEIAGVGFDPTLEGSVARLREPASDRLIPIRVGSPEAISRVEIG
jgi:hypothetical protein